MRRLSLVLAALLIMLIGFVASLLMLGDQARLKQLLAMHVEQQLGRQLEIEGAVSVRFFPRLQVEARDVRLSGPGPFAGRDLLESGRLMAEIRVLPLVLGRMETSELVLSDARLNLRIDEQGEHNFSGLVRHRQREATPGMVVDGPLRLENLQLHLDVPGMASWQRVVVDRIELDGLAFDRALKLVFRGAIGSPALIEDVSLTGILYIPAATGHFRLADMSLSGRVPGAETPFELGGALEFSALAPAHMKLELGRLRFAGQALDLEGEYISRQRPFYRLAASAESLDGQETLRMLGHPGFGGWLEAAAAWTAVHDFVADFQVQTLWVDAWPLANLGVSVEAQEGVVSVTRGRAALPGGYVEIAGDLTVQPDSSLLTAQARIEIDDLQALLSSAGVPLLAEGAGQVLIEPLGEPDSTIAARGTLRFFDGRIAALADLWRALGLEGHTDFSYLEGEFLLHSDHLYFPNLLVQRETLRAEFQGLSVGPGEEMSGEVVIRGEDVGEHRQRVSGRLSRPDFSPLIPEPADR